MADTDVLELAVEAYVASLTPAEFERLIAIARPDATEVI